MTAAVNAAEVVDSGTCGADGDNLTWTLDNKGTLTISGTGEMEYHPSWSSTSAIKTVIIEAGVTSIGNVAFLNCSSLTDITIPASVTHIDASAFLDCDSLTDVYYSGTQEQWDTIKVEDNNAPLTNATLHCNAAPVETWQLGDVNHDGDVNVYDAAWILQYAVGFISDKAPSFDWSLGDITSDGRIDADDATMVLQYDAQLITAFPPKA